MNPTIKIVPDAQTAAPRVVDPAAHVSSGAEIGSGCIIMPFAVIGEGVRLGPGCKVHPHAVIQGPTSLGPNNEIHSFACIGGSPQDLRHRDEPTELLIGEGNTFREMVTVNRGTVHGGGRTVIGDFNLFMAYSHIAHDCCIGNRAVFANHATLAGHTTVQDFAVFGGMVAVGTFLRIGESAMLAAGSMVERDVAPFCMVAGDRARLRALNRVGMVRRGFDDRVKREIKEVFRALRDPSQKLSEIVRAFRASTESLSEVKSGNDVALFPEIERMLTFIESATRGIVR